MGRGHPKSSSGAEHAGQSTAAYELEIVRPASVYKWPVIDCAALPTPPEPSGAAVDVSESCNVLCNGAKTWLGASNPKKKAAKKIPSCTS